MTAPPKRPPVRYAVRGALVAMAALALAGAVYFVAVTPPTPDSLYPKCSLHQLTGLHCPGCGVGRATHAALNGRFAQAAAYNPVAVVLLPVIAAVVLAQAVRWALGRPPRDRFLLSGRMIALLAAGLVLFMVLRNIPVEPFTLLAPHELEPAAGAR